MEDRDVLEFVYDKLFSNDLDVKEKKIEKVISDPELDYHEITFTIDGRRYVLSIG